MRLKGGGKQDGSVSVGGGNRGPIMPNPALAPQMRCFLRTAPWKAVKGEIGQLYKRTWGILKMNFLKFYIES